MLPLTKILCPTDFSAPSQEAIKVGQELASVFGSELILVHVISPVPTLPEVSGVAAPGLLLVDQELESLARQSLEKLIETLDLKTWPCRLVVLLGNPADEIVRSADQEKADLIVIATQGRTGLNRLIFGSVAEKTVRLAHCPVLTIPAQGPKKSEEIIPAEGGTIVVTA